MPLDPSKIAALTVLLSPERLGKLTQLTGSAEQAIELHQETLRLGAALMNVTAAVEIALRNSVCENLSHYFAAPDWLIRPPVPFQWRSIEQSKILAAADSARRAEYSKMTQTQKAGLDALAYPKGRPPNTSHLKRSKDRRKFIQVSEGKVIAELSLYFWKRLYSPDYDQSLWRTSLKKTFPNKAVSRAEVAQRLECIYQSRNRLAHHESVLRTRFADAMAAIEFVIRNLGARVPSNETPLAELLSADIAEVHEMAAELHGRLDSFKV